MMLDISSSLLSFYVSTCSIVQLVDVCCVVYVYEFVCVPLFSLAFGIVADKWNGCLVWEVRIVDN